MTQLMTFQRYAYEALSPTVLQGERGQKLLPGTLGVLFDALTEGANQGVKARFPTSDTFPPDALPYVGAGKALERYPIDTDATYKARVLDAWDAWAQAGTPTAIVRQLAALGLTATIKENHTAGWNWDGSTANWSRFWVVITGHPWVGWTWGDGSIWGQPDLTWGSTATVDDVRSVRALVRKWKPAHVVCANIIVVLDAGTWAAEQPDGTWGDPANRSAAAIYWNG